MLTLHNIVVER